VATAALFTLLALAGVVAMGAERPLTQLGLGRGRVRLRGLVALVLGTSALSLALDAVLRLAGLRESGSLAEFDRAIADTRGISLFVAVGAFALAPALGEEILFRGLLQRGLVPRLGPAPAITLAAGAFAAVHGDLVHAGAAFGLGLYLGTMAHLAGSIRVSALCHATNNLAAVLSAASESGPTPIPTALIPALALAALGALGLARRWRAPPSAGTGVEADQ
jgi:membrane protease YdiL (CAAX protease family)